MWLCSAPELGITWASEVDASSPALGIDCHEVTIDGNAPSATKWNAGIRWLRYLLLG